MQFLIGADPEVFVKAKNRMVTAYNFVPGDKKKPLKVDRGAIQVDGVALEFNIDPVDNEDEFLFNIKNVMGILDTEMKTRNGRDNEFAITPFAKFSKDVWTNTPDTAKVLGCDPDYSAETGLVNPNPGDALANQPIRTASGHIHIGWTKVDNPLDVSHFEDCKTVAKFFHDSGIFSAKTPAEHARLKYYGMNGSFRPKPYGVELRAPSNIWLNSEASIQDMFRNVKRVFNELAG